MLISQKSWRKDKVVYMNRAGLNIILKEPDWNNKGRQACFQNKIIMRKWRKYDWSECKNIILHKLTIKCSSFILIMKVFLTISILSLKELPRSMLVVGGGVVGCEFSVFCNTRHKGDNSRINASILLNEDEEVSNAYKQNIYQKRHNIQT